MIKGVCAVVVTFNRKELLVRNLLAIRSQTFPPHNVVIIDNASTDDTTEYLKEEGFIDKLSVLDLENVELESHKKIGGVLFTYFRLKTNLGGAGGFYHGQKYAFEQKFQWTWLMDDDGFPSNDCLEVLVHSCKKYHLHAVNPLVFNEKDPERLAFGLRGVINTKDQAFNQGDENGLLFGTGSPFNGTLLSYQLIEKIGLIKKEMFIWGDEREYFYRILKNNYSFTTVLNASFFHPFSRTNYRSKLFGAITVATKPSHLEMNFYRNQGFINSNYKNWASHKTILKIMLFHLLDFKFKKSVLSFMYYIDGASNSFKLKNILKV